MADGTQASDIEAAARWLDGSIGSMASEECERLASVLRSLAASPSSDPEPDVVKRVARAIARGCNLDPDADSPRAAKNGHSIPEWMFFVPAARAALAAIPDPEPDVVERFVENLQNELDDRGSARLDVWQENALRDALAAMLEPFATFAANNMSPNKEQLEPCPFCGKADAFVERADYSSCYIICNDCGSRGPTSCNENEDDCAAEDAGMEPGENAARRLWNTRASQLRPEKEGA